MNDVQKMRFVNDPTEMEFLTKHKGELDVPYSYPSPAGLLVDADELRRWRKLRDCPPQSEVEPK